MSPSLALLLWAILLIGLLRFDPAREPRSSLALWVPIIWLFFVASRLPSQWLGGSQVQLVTNALQEGNSIDRTVDLVFILLAIGILASRSFRWGDFFRRNLALTVYFGFALLSVFWSDFAFIAFKRWFRDLGGYLVILVILSDPRPLEAIRTVLRRFSYLLIPLSILLIKYYSELGRQYNPWTGTAEYVGATTSKNDLGEVCLVCGLFFFWDIVTRWSSRREPRSKRILLVNLAFMAMTLWLLNMANSATSRVCLLVGCSVIAAAHTRIFQRRPKLLKVIVPSIFFLYLILVFGFNLNGQMAAAVGRNPNLTDRTLIWKVLLGMHTNPLLGTGYDSFWLGSRLQWLWQQPAVGGINEAHNGFLEVYLNLGLIGLLLLIGFVISSYRIVCRRLTFTEFGSFALAFWLVFLFHNVTEADFRCGLMWLTFLLGAIAYREHVKVQAGENTPFGGPPQSALQPLAWDDNPEFWPSGGHIQCVSAGSH